MRLPIFCAVLCLNGALLAQDLLPSSSILSPKNYLREHFERPVPSVQLKEPARLGDYVVDGHFELSLKSYLDLVMANNTDIEITRLSIETSRNSITNAFGTFDPSLTLSFTPSRSTSVNTSVIESTTSVVSRLNQPFSARYQQTLQSGTQFNFTYSGSRSATSATSTAFNPTLSSSMQANLTQPLLRNRGGYITKIPIMQARSRYRQQQYSIEDSIMRAVQTAELAYWDVIEARESLKVQEAGLALQDQQLQRSNKQLELGAISPLEIYRPQQSYANAEIAVTRARYTLAQREDALRRQIGADLNPQYRDTPITLTETVQPPDDNPLDKEALVRVALDKRPDLKRTRQQVDVDDLSLKSARNGLLPNLSLTANYSSSGTGGLFTERDRLTQEIIRTVPGGYSDVLDQIFHFTNPTYGMGLSLTLPIRDRSASVAMANAVVAQKQTALNIRSAEQSARLDVLNAVTQVENSRAQVRQSQVALDFAQKNADAEQKRYDLGVTDIYFVLDAQNALTLAQSNLVTTQIQYQRNLLNLLRVTGQLLEERGIVIDVQ